MGEETNDPIDEFLAQTLLFEKNHTPSLQGFLHWLAGSESEIKRDMEQSRNAVRIMTVHGAKGLQAPIVILPDTVTPPRLKDTLLWNEGENADLPLWSSSSKRDDTLSAGLRETQKRAMMEEYRRLLYVALTRAEDHLYVTGAASRDSVSDESWYSHVQAGLSAIAQKIETKNGEGLRLGNAPKTVAGKSQKPWAAAAQVFSFLAATPPAEPLPPKPLAPSRQPDDVPSATSPLKTDIFARGILIHKLLQHLPSVPPETRAALAAKLSRTSGLDDAQQKRCLDEALAVINDSRFGFIFSEGALAEAPVTGTVLVNNQPVTLSGQIDRLAITDDAVWIVDFKTGTIPKTTPKAYLRQMGLYKLLLEGIYPQKQVHCALVWSAMPRIDVLDEAALATYI